jgi:ribose transport system substrate-binding protein
MYRTGFPLLAATGLSALLLSGCATSSQTESPAAAGEVLKGAACTEVVQAGPDGETATDGKVLSLTPDEISQFKALGRTIRVGTFWQAPTANGDLMMEGMKAAWDEYGLDVEIISETNANFDSPTQATQIETTLALKPDAMIGILVDATALQPVISKVNAADIPLIFWDVSAGGDTEYTSIVTSNGRQAGCLAADALAAAIDNTGKVAVLPMAFAFYPTDQRVAGFVDRMESTYPDISIVATVGATGESDGITQGQGLLQRFPDLDGMFASWADPARGVAQAAKTLGRSDVIVTTVDVNEATAAEIASCGIIRAAATQLPYDEGFAEGILLAKAMIGAEVPQFVVTDTPIATHESVLDVFEQVYHSAPPADLVDSLADTCS